MKELTDYQSETLRLINQSTKENPITGQSIALKIGLRFRSTGKEGADMRSIIHAIRVKGYPICANTKGYYYARTLKELSEFIMSLNGRIAKMEESVTGLHRSFNRVGEDLQKDNKQGVML